MQFAGDTRRRAEVDGINMSALGVIKLEFTLGSYTRRPSSFIVMCGTDCVDRKSSLENVCRSLPSNSGAARVGMEIFLGFSIVHDNLCLSRVGLRRVDTQELFPHFTEDPPFRSGLRGADGSLCVPTPTKAMHAGKA